MSRSRDKLSKTMAMRNGDEEEEVLAELMRRQTMIDGAPFRKLRISDAAKLSEIEGRKRCESCRRSRKFFCYTCCLPVIDKAYFPRMKLPIKIDIIKHRCEVAGKSTAVHAVILAPDDARIYVYPDFPEISDKEKTVLIFPSKTAVNVEDIFAREKEGKDDSVSAEAAETEFPIERAVFIDSTWQQSNEIYRDKRLRELRCVILRSRISQFWRHQKNSPRWYLATIEAIHQFLVELHTCAFGAMEGYADLDGFESNAEQSHSVIDDGIESIAGYSEADRRYRGQYDDLLYFFKYMYDYIHSIYDHDQLLAYKRRLV